MDAAVADTGLATTGSGTVLAADGTHVPFNPERPRLSIQHNWTTLGPTFRPRGPPTRREDHPAHVLTAPGPPSPAPQPSEASITGALVPRFSSLPPDQAFFIRYNNISRLIYFAGYPSCCVAVDGVHMEWPHRLLVIERAFSNGKYGQGGANWGLTLASVGGAGRLEAVD
jgi:hypothetical protein